MLCAKANNYNNIVTNGCPTLKELPTALRYACKRTSQPMQTMAYYVLIMFGLVV